MDNRGRGVSRFSVEIFLSDSPKLFVEESFTVAVMSGTGSVWIRRGSIKVFRRDIFVPQCRKFW